MTTATALNLFIPITKVDVAQRLVYGLATAEKMDRSGEVCDYASTKPFYEKWSGDISKSTDGKSLGNIRAMHGKVAAGKVTAINFNDADKQIEICAKVIDDNEWNKVQEGVYTGFSHGGAYVKRWKDGEVQKYTADPSEISLVDLPCLDVATFSVIKADGATEMRKFVTAPAVADPTNDQIVARANEMAKAAGTGKTFADFIVEARAELVAVTEAVTKAAEPVEKAVPAVVAPVTETAVVPALAADVAPVAKVAAEDEWAQVWLCKRDGSTHATKAALRKHLDDLDADTLVKAAAAPTQTAMDELTATLGIEKAAPTTSGKSGTKADATAADQGKDPVTGAKKKGKKPTKKDMAPDELKKGLYFVGQLCSIISDLRYLQSDAMYEAEYEGDGSTVPDQLKSNIADLCMTLRDIVAEETSELFDPTNANDALLIAVMEMAAGMKPSHMDAMSKVATGDDKFAKSLDGITKFVAAGKPAETTVVLKVETAAVADDLSKAADALSKETARGDALQKALDGFQVQLTEVTKAVGVLLAQPVPHPLTRLVSKGQDNGGGVEPTAEELLAKMTPDQLALLAIKAAQANGQPLMKRGS